MITDNQSIAAILMIAAPSSNIIDSYEKKKRERKLFELRCWIVWYASERKCQPFKRHGR